MTPISTACVTLRRLMVRSRLVLVAFLMLPIFGQTAYSNDYPTQPISIVIPFSAGGGFDVMARVVAKRVSDVLGKPVIVENRAGAGGVLAATYVANANPDGHTLLLAIDSMMTMLPHVRSATKFDPEKDFVPVSAIHVSEMLIVANPKLGVKSFNELLAHMKAHPRVVNVASASINARLYLELLKREQEVDFVFVPFRGSTEILPALISGQIDLVVADSSPYVPLVEQGKVVAIATTGTKMSGLPHVPSMADVGYPNLEVMVWSGLFAPAKTSPDVVKKLNVALATILKEPALVAQMRQLGREMGGSQPAELGSKVRTESKRWVDLIKAANISFD